MTKILERLIAGAGACTADNACPYHASKRNNISITLPSIKLLAGGSDGILDSTPATRLLMELMVSSRQPAGSWSFVLEERRWLCARFGEIAAANTEISILILGLAGLTHFVDTLSLLLESSPKASLRIYVIDRCITPLADVEYYFTGAGKKLFPNVRLAGAWRNVATCCDRATVELVHSDILVAQLPVARSIDVVLSHYLFRFMDASTATACVEMIASKLRPAGRLVAAQDKTDYMPEGVSKYFEDRNFRILKEGVSWAPYKLGLSERTEIREGRSIRVALDCDLLDAQIDHALN
jgi:hypothetical protein